MRSITQHLALLALAMSLTGAASNSRADECGDVVQEINAISASARTLRGAAIEEDDYCAAVGKWSQTINLVNRRIALRQKAESVCGNRLTDGTTVSELRNSIARYEKDAAYSKQQCALDSKEKADTKKAEDDRKKAEANEKARQALEIKRKQDEAAKKAAAEKPEDANCGVGFEESYQDCVDESGGKNCKCVRFKNSCPWAVTSYFVIGVSRTSAHVPAKSSEQRCATKAGTTVMYLHSQRVP